MTLHVVPNQHLHLFPIFYTSWSPPTIQNTFLKLLQLNLYWEGSVMQVHSNTFRPFFNLTKAFHVGGSTFRKLSHHVESFTTFNYFIWRVKCKNPFFETHSHTTLQKLCAWTSLNGAFIERENSRPITSWHVTLLSPQDTANYKAAHITARFCYHYSETNRNLPSVIQEPITPQHV